MLGVFVAEFVASAYLLVAVVGSGIAAEALSGGNVALALLANALATGAALYVLILVVGPLSGAHMNPLVSLAAVLTREMRCNRLPVYFAAQVLGSLAGTILSHGMFGQPLLQVSQHERSGASLWTAEVVATIGLLAAIWGCAKYGRPVLAGAVGAYIAGAYWFTSSTSFANPAVTMARTMTDTFAGIRPIDAPAFIISQFVGLILVIPLLRHLKKSDDTRSN